MDSVEIEAEGNKHSLYLTVLMYIESFGESNVRSSVVGHSAEKNRPLKLSEFIQRYDTVTRFVIKRL